MRISKFAFLFTMIFICICAYSQSNSTQESQWDFFRNVIPQSKSISFSNSTSDVSGRWSNGTTTTWTMTINDKYRVSFSGKIQYRYYSESTRSATNNDYTVNFEGAGLIAWENEKMVIKLPITGSGSYNGQYETPNRWGDFYGDHVTHTNASGRSSHNVNFDIQPEYLNGKFSGKIMLSAQTLSLTMTGQTTQSASLAIGGNTWHIAVVTPKSASDLNTSSGDAFGAWNWNSDRTRLFLKSENSDNRFVIINNNSALIWSMELISGVKGSSENTIETGEKLINLAMSIDGTPAQNISFIENNEGTTEKGFIRLDYVVFNRFLGTLDKNSGVFLNQIKGGYMLILTYTINGANRNDMFLLEGLSTILEYLK